MTLDPIVEVLRDERIRQQLSIRTLAGMAGVNPSSVQRWEMGRRGLSLYSFRAWAGALGFDVGLRRRR